MKILGIEHLAIAVESIDDSAPFWSHILKIPHRKTEVVESEGVTTDIYDTGRGKVELLESLGEDSPINNFLKKRGPGIHHVCFEVEDINSAIITPSTAFTIPIRIPPKICCRDEGKRIKKKFCQVVAPIDLVM